MKLCLRCNQYYEDAVDLCPKDSGTLEFVGKYPLIGALVSDRYIVESVIGKGSSGIVYKALRLQHGEVSVALKVLHSYLSASNNSLDHFLREASAASRLRNPHIITIWDRGVTDDGQPYFVMDYLEGMTLGKLIREKGALPARRALAIVKQICEALSEAHKQGIIHRDLKPENIMLQEVDSGNDYVKVLDFGIADSPQDIKPQLEPIKFVAGSPAYMSPEQCQGFELDPRSDIYSLGIVVFEMLTGKRPFKFEEHVSMMFLHVSRPPLLLSEAAPELNFSHEADKVMAAALAKIPDQRQNSVEDFWQELENAFVGYEENQAAPTPLPAQLLKSHNAAAQAANRQFMQPSDVETQTLVNESSDDNEPASQSDQPKQFGIGVPIKRALERTFQDIKAVSNPNSRLDLDLSPAANDPQAFLPEKDSPQLSNSQPENESMPQTISQSNFPINLETSPESLSTLHKKDVSTILEKLIETVAEEGSNKSPPPSRPRTPDAAAETADIILTNSEQGPVSIKLSSQKSPPPSLPMQSLPAVSSSHRGREMTQQHSSIANDVSNFREQVAKNAPGRAAPPQAAEASLSKFQLTIVLMLSSIFAFAVCAAINLAMHQQLQPEEKPATKQNSNIEKVNSPSVAKHGKPE